MAVFPGDILVGDDDGVMVIPSHLAKEVAVECLEMTLFEDFVMYKVNQGHPVIGLYPLTNSELKIEFEAWKGKR